MITGGSHSYHRQLTRVRQVGTELDNSRSTAAPAPLGSTTDARCSASSNHALGHLDRRRYTLRTQEDDDTYWTMDDVTTWFDPRRCQVVPIIALNGVNSGGRQMAMMQRLLGRYAAEACLATWGRRSGTAAAAVRKPGMAPNGLTAEPGEDSKRRKGGTGALLAALERAG